MIDEDLALVLACGWFFDLLDAHGIDFDRWNWVEDDGPDFCSALIDDIVAGFKVEARVVRGCLVFIRWDRLGFSCIGHITLQP